jgi:hypothetical protein
MIRGVSVSLPAAAEAKLQEFQLTRDAALDAARSAQARLNALPRDADQQMRDRLIHERDRHNHRHQQLGLLVNKVNQWVMENRMPLAPAPHINVELQPNELLSTAIANVRNEIQVLHQHLAAVKVAPLPLEDQQQLAEAYVARLVATAGPQQINFHGDKLSLRWRDDIVASKEDALALFAWGAPDQVYAALVRAIKAQPVRSDAMSAEARTRRVAELEAELQALEYREEALVLRAAGDGLEVLRRPDAAPAAVLGVQVVARQTAAA